MKNLLRYIAFVLMVGGVCAQSNLPACQGSNSVTWSDCFSTYSTLYGVYTGEWKDGEYSGKGTANYPNGNKYVGEFKNGKRNGQGVYTFYKGNIYFGEFKDGRFNGEGTLYSSTGSIISQGIWADDTFVRSAPVQQATAPSVQQSNTPNSEIKKQSVRRQRV